MLPIVAAAVALNLSWAPADNCAHTFGFISDGQRQREINDRNVVEKRSARSADHDHHQQRLVRQALGQTHGQTDRPTGSDRADVRTDSFPFFVNQHCRLGQEENRGDCDQDKWCSGGGGGDEEEGVIIIIINVPRSGGCDMDETAARDHLLRAV